ncbi:hypothetical protein CEXT_335621 [Caerostris extrusa]|uniref:Uncharacterized protein n=1 Tax=Caerostris extrusa TaxID=172846 RepID=A0AAV4W6K1_CAEEX|nr:hypothetical protein CEXT_335621 [Caerostris extrusa]
MDRPERRAAGIAGLRIITGPFRAERSGEHRASSDGDTTLMGNSPVSVHCVTAVWSRTMERKFGAKLELNQLEDTIHDNQSHRSG